MEISDRLREISEGYAEGLRPEVRRRLVRAGVESVTSRRGGAPRLIWGYLPQVAVAAAVTLVLAFPALYMLSSTPSGERTPISDLTVTRVGDKVVLAWSDGDQPRRVVKATSREQLAHLERLPGEMVRGERWVDTRASDAEITYYVVE